MSTIWSLSRICASYVTHSTLKILQSHKKLTLIFDLMKLKVLELTEECTVNKLIWCVMWISLFCLKFLLQSASYLAQKGATGKTKKDNLEYAKAAWEKISEKYEVRANSSLLFVTFKHKVCNTSAKWFLVLYKCSGLSAVRTVFFQTVYILCSSLQFCCLS